MDYMTKKHIRKTFSGIGFLVFTITLSMAVLAAIIVYPLYKYFDTTAMLMLQMLVSVSCMFLTGLFYCWMSKSDLNSLITVRWVKLRRAVPLIMIGLCTAFIADYVADWVQQSFSVFGLENTISFTEDTATPIENILSIIAVAVVPPLTEEFVFRGIILGKLRKYGDGFAVLMSSVLFGMIHENIVQIPFAFIVGLAAAFVTVKCESILPAMFIHFVVNFRSVLFDILKSNKVMEENALNVIYVLFLLVVFVLAIISAAVLSKDREFFKLERRKEYPYPDLMGAFVGNAGMILFIVIVTINTVSTLALI